MDSKHKNRKREVLVGDVFNHQSGAWIISTNNLLQIKLVLFPTFYLAWAFNSSHTGGSVNQSLQTNRHHGRTKRRTSKQCGPQPMLRRHYPELGRAAIIWWAQIHHHPIVTAWPNTSKFRWKIGCIRGLWKEANVGLEGHAWWSRSHMVVVVLGPI